MARQRFMAQLAGLPFLLGLCLTSALPLFAQKDTPKMLMDAAKTYQTTERKELQKQTDKFFARLTRDRAYASSLFTAVQKSDKEATRNIVADGMAISPTRVNVSHLDKDLLVNITIENDKSSVSICIDSVDGRCDHGASSSVTIVTRK